MSSKRGRKRNDNLPPNRARDVQRAFRARRAAHLQALEDRVAELEEENDTLRASLNLPPANRPPLGRGPTGKDKIKSYDRASTQAESILGEGSASPGTNHSSPHSVHQQMSHVGTSNASGSMWNGALTMPQHDDYGSEQDNNSSVTQGGPSASTSYAPEPHFRFDTSQASRTRSSLSSALYASPDSSGYHHSTDRPSNSSTNFSREESFYQMTGTSSGHRNVTQSSPAMHPHSVQHHMESPMVSHSSFSPAPSASPPVSLSMSMGLQRRSIHDPQYLPSYVDPYSTASYPQRGQPTLPHQTHSSIHSSSSNSRSPHNYAGISRSGFGGPDQSSNTSDPSVRRTT